MICRVCKRARPDDHYRVRTRADGTTKRDVTCRACVSERRKRQYNDRPKDSGMERLPAGPFRDWLLKRLEVYGSTGQLAAACGLIERRVYGVLSGRQEFVSLDVVDRALVHEGSTHLDELYPYEEAA